MSASSNSYLTINAASGHELDNMSRVWGFEDRYKGESDVSFRLRLVSYIRAMDLLNRVKGQLGGIVQIRKARRNNDSHKIAERHIYVVREYRDSSQYGRWACELVIGGEGGRVDLFKVERDDFELGCFAGYRPPVGPIEERLGEVVEGDVTAGGRTVEPQAFTPVEPNDDEEMSVDDMLGHYEVLRLRAEEINQAAAIANAELNGALLKLELLFESRGWNISRIKGDVK